MFGNKRKLILFVLGGIGLYLLVTGLSFAVFNSRKTPSLIEPVVTPAVRVSKFKIDTSAARTEVCPLNGQKFTKAEQVVWSTRRPLGVMIENHEDSRPQSGLSKADVIYEAVAEGGITRFLSLFYCGGVASAQDSTYDLGPVRSARTYYLDLVSEYSDYPLYAHVGGAGNCNDPTVDPRAKALCQIGKYGWLNKETWSDLNQFALSYKECRQEKDRIGHPVDTEHSMYCGSEALWARAEVRQLTNVNYGGTSWDRKFRSWLFKEDAPSTKGVSPQFDFWKGDKAYNVRWEYDGKTNSYKRFNGGQPQMDFNNNQQLSAKNVVVQFAKEARSVDEHKHLLYGVVGEGKALVFQDGQVINATWAKKSRTDRTIFRDAKGKEIQFNRGQIWIEILPTGSEVTY